MWKWGILMPSDQPRERRRSIRLPGHDYTQPGAYFVTICTHGGECLFDDPILRRVVETMWQRIPRHFPQVSLDAWVVMPNHLHDILTISDIPTVGARHSQRGPSLTMASTSGAGIGSAHDSPRNASPLPTGASPGSLGAIIGNFKSVTTRRIHQIRRTSAGPIWQRNYYEHIIRTERALHAIRRYIAENPARWHLDKYNTQATGPDPMATELWRLLS
jgi:putative transposase